MIGAKSGQQVLILGAGDGTLAAAVALVTGLNGRTLVIDRAGDAQARVEASAAAAGALVEFERAPVTMLPLQNAAFDLVVAVRDGTDPATELSQVIAEASRVVRQGGRVIVIEGVKRAGLLGRLGRPAIPPPDANAAREALERAGLRAARVLAEVDGIAYVEAARPRS